MKITLTSVSIADYDKALQFYTEVLGFVKKRDIPLGGGARWLTVVSPEEPDGTEVLLEPNADYPAMKALKESLLKDGIPFTGFQVNDIQKEYARLKKLGVEFTMEPTNMGMTTMAVFNDTCVTSSRSIILLAYSPAGVWGPQAPAVFLFCCSLLPALLATTSSKMHVLGGLRPPNLPTASLPAVSFNNRESLNTYDPHNLHIAP